jgi:hypothetical protein
MRFILTLLLVLLLSSLNSYSKANALFALKDDTSSLSKPVKGKLIIRLVSNFALPKTDSISLASIEATYPSLYDKLVNFGAVSIKPLLPHRINNPYLVQIPNDTFDLESFYVVRFDTSKSVLSAFESLGLESVIKSIDYVYNVYIDAIPNDSEYGNSPTNGQWYLSLVHLTWG